MGTKSGAFLVFGRYGLAKCDSSTAGDQESIPPYGESVQRSLLRRIRIRVLVVVLAPPRSLQSPRQSRST